MSQHPKASYVSDEDPWADKYTEPISEEEIALHYEEADLDFGDLDF